MRFLRGWTAEEWGVCLCVGWFVYLGYLVCTARTPVDVQQQRLDNLQLQVSQMEMRLNQLECIRHRTATSSEGQE